MLEDKIYKDYVEALKSKDRHRVDFLSFVRAGLKNYAIQLKKDKLDDQEVIKVLKGQQKRLADSKESIVSSGRKELLKNLETELAILSEYLPQPMDESQLARIIDEVIESSGASSMKDMGKVMKAVLEKVGAAADNRKISEIIKTKLSSR
ncbi:MAG: GatB/YqeY domain-containing protein [Candidatus Omnitrophota bacterium]|nr:MAG: GatB/YqeY domain-containing protein [Candidatus Omnitrophota bacterium]